MNIAWISLLQLIAKKKRQHVTATTALGGSLNGPYIFYF